MEVTERGLRSEYAKACADVHLLRPPPKEPKDLRERVVFWERVVAWLPKMFKLRDDLANLVRRGRLSRAEAKDQLEVQLQKVFPPNYVLWMEEGEMAKARCALAKARWEFQSSMTPASIPFAQGQGFKANVFEPPRMPGFDGEPFYGAMDTNIGYVSNLSSFGELPPLPDQQQILTEQIRIIGEPSIPYEVRRKLPLTPLSQSDEDSLLFQRKLAAIIKLGDLRDQGAVITLVALVENRIFGVNRLDPQKKLWLHQAATEALAQIGGTLAFSKLGDLLKSKDPKQRMLAARGLREATGGKVATDLLTALKTETDATIKVMIISALGNAGKDLGVQEKQSIATELIRQMETNAKGAVHSAAINALGKLRLKIATEPLLKQLTKLHGDGPLSQDIVRALGEIADARAVNLVVVMLEVHVNEGVRNEAALALGKIGGTKAREALQRRLKLETKPSVKANILKALTALTPVIRWTFK